MSIVMSVKLLFFSCFILNAMVIPPGLVFSMEGKWTELPELSLQFDTELNDSETCSCTIKADNIFAALEHGCALCLMSYKTQVNDRSQKWPHYPFETACFYGHVHLAKILLKLDAIFDKERIDKECLLHSCVKHLPIVKLLVEQGVKIDHRDGYFGKFDGCTALYESLYNSGRDECYPETALYLIDKGASVGEIGLKHSYNSWFIFLAVEKEQSTVITRAVQAGAEVDQKDEYEHTPLAHALHYKRSEKVVNSLIAQGAKFKNLKNPQDLLWRFDSIEIFINNPTLMTLLDQEKK